jgi:hypothetical protein
MAYRYNGKGRNEDGTPPRPRIPGQFDPSACGTYKGYRRHTVHNVPICRDCRAACAAYSRSRYKPKPPRGFTTEACGTWAGRRRHDYYNIPVCDACRAAASEYQRRRRAGLKANA